MAFTAYFDESGTDDESSAVTMAGFLSTTERWKRFECEWAAILMVNEIDFFHMTDFAQRVEQFKGWSEEKRQRCLKALHDVIERHAIGSIGFGLSRAAYNRIVSPEASNFMGGAYGLLAATILMELSGLLQVSGVKGMLAYRFESGAEGIGQVATVFNRNLRSANNSQHFRLLSFGTEDKRRFLPLQAADILAYELHKQLPKQLGLDDRASRQFPLPSLARTPNLWGYINQDNLATFNRVTSVGARLTDKQLDWEQAPEESQNPTFRIPISQFQQRWRFYSRFMATGDLSRERTALSLRSRDR